MKSWVLLLLIIATNAFAFEGDHISVRIIGQHQQLQPGSRSWIAVELAPEPGWHVYWKNPGDSGLPPSISFELPEGVTAGPLMWPVPKQFQLPEGINYGYHHALFLTQIRVDESVSKNSSLQIGADISWLVCKEQCIPGKTKESIVLPVAGQLTESGDYPKILQAIDRLPQNTTINGQFSVQGKQVILSLDNWGFPIAESREMQWFVQNEELVDYGEKPEITLENNRLVAKFSQSDYFKRTPENVRVLIVPASGKAMAVSIPAGLSSRR